MSTELLGTLAFGVVIGWVTYRTLRRSSTGGLSDIAAVIGAVGGGAITALFPVGSRAFNAYGIGLAIGFFLYLITATILAARTTGLTPVNEWLGNTGAAAAPSTGRRHGDAGDDDPMPPL